MQFLNPLVLLALAAAAVPLLLHLLQKRKLRAIEFSTLRFLKEIQKTAVRTIKLRQILLLILRTLIIVFIVLAFARPAVRGTIGGIGSHARSSVVILLDNSLSMAARDAHGQVFEEAQQAAMKIAGMLNEGDNAALVPLAQLQGDAAFQPTHDFAQLKRAVAAVKIVPCAADIGEGLRVASSILNTSQNPNKEVYLITDEQRHSFDTSGAARRLVLFDAKTRLYVIHAGTRGRREENLSVDSIHCETAVFERNKPLDVTAFIRNNGNVAAAGVSVHLMLDGNNAAQRSVAIPARGVATVELSAPLQHTGLVPLAVTVDDDAIETDNTRSAALFIPRQLRIALVAQNPAEERFIRLALAQQQDSPGMFQITDVPPSRLPGVNFSSYDVLVFASLPQFSFSVAQRFRQYMNQGGGAVIFAGGSADAYNAAAGITRLPPATETALPAGSQLAFGSFDETHPLFRDVFQRSQAQSANHIVTESPAIHTYMRIVEDPSLETIIRLANGAPFLAQKNIGEGIAIVCAVPPTPEWSDLPYKTIFLPLVMRSVLYTGAQDVIGVSQCAGAPFDLSIRKRQNLSAAVIVRAPDGMEMKIEPRLQPASALVPVGPQTQCGVYEAVSTDSVPLAAFAVNPDPGESDLRAIPETEIRSLLLNTLPAVGKNNVAFLDATDDITSKILQLRFGVELWKYCIIAALVCLVAEMIVARTYKNEIEEHPLVEKAR